jgi:SNF2 family DNA or RNA helicase
MIDDFKDGNLEKEQQIPILEAVLSASYTETLTDVVADAVESLPTNAPSDVGAKSAEDAPSRAKGAKRPRTESSETSGGGQAQRLEPDSETPSLASADLDTISFGELDDSLGNIVQVLSCEPPIFYEKNFTEILTTCYKYWRTHMNIVDAATWALANNTAKTGKDKLSDEEVFVARWGDPAQLSSFAIDINHTHEISKIFAEPLFKKEEISNITLIKFFLNIPPSYLHKLCYGLRFMHVISIFARKLVEKSAIIPQLLQNDSKITFIRWIPALFDRNVKNTCWRLSKMCPPNLITFHNKPLPQMQQVISAASLFIAAYTRNNFPHSLYKHADNRIFRLFFTGKPLLPSKNVAERETPSSIHNWLSRLFLFDRRHKLYLLVNDHGRSSFSLDVRVIADGLLVPISTALESKEMKLALLSELCLLFEYLPELASTIDSNQDVIFDTKEFTRIFMQVLPVLRSIGIEVILPKSLRNLLKPRLTLKMSVKDKASALKSFVNMESMVNFDWRIAVGSKELTIEEFRDLVSKSQGLIEIRDEYVILDEKEILQLLAKTDKLTTEMDYSDFMQAALAKELDGTAVSLDKKLASLFQTLEQVEPAALPTNLRATMRPYQERGFHWLMQNIRLGFGSILADDMGLGKTLQVISVILALKNDGVVGEKNKVLIVVPTSLLSNWQKEFEKFAPSIRFFIYHGLNRKAEPIPDDIDVLITSYGLVRRDMRELNKSPWFMVVIDEAQNIKNSKTEQAKSIKGIHAVHKIAMSGTPVENRLLEYWSIFDFTNKNYMGSQASFVRRYAAPIERSRDAHSLELFKKVTSPFILRRLKSDKSIISDLPEKIENNRYCSLTAQQAALYQGVVNNCLDEIGASEGIARKGLILSMINSLKQICNHPAHYTKVGSATIAQSGKTELLEEILCEIDETSSEKVIIFTQYTEMGDILVDLLEKRFHSEVPFLHGGLSRTKRDQIVNDFQTRFSSRILIVSLRAGGTGLNLTAANHVIHYDLWWNPAVETQATDRAYRIGQMRNVMVHRFLTKGTFEERIDDMISSKRDLANLTVVSGEAFITNMTTHELEALVSLR